MHGNWHEYRERLVKITDKVVKSHGLAVTVPQKDQKSGLWLKSR